MLIERPLVVTRGHSWSLVVTRGHSWSFVVTRGHSCVLLDKTQKNSLQNIIVSNEDLAECQSDADNIMMHMILMMTMILMVTLIDDER